MHGDVEVVEPRFGVHEDRFGFDDIAELRDDEPDLTDRGDLAVRGLNVDGDDAVLIWFHEKSIAKAAAFRNCELAKKYAFSACAADGAGL